VFTLECKAQGVPPTRTCDDTALSASTLSSLCLMATINAVSEQAESSWLIVLNCELDESGADVLAEACDVLAETCDVLAEVCDVLAKICDVLAEVCDIMAEFSFIVTFKIKLEFGDCVIDSVILTCFIVVPPFALQGINFKKMILNEFVEVKRHLVFRVRVLCCQVVDATR
jgi:hypothetical protein